MVNLVLRARVREKIPGVRVALYKENEVWKKESWLCGIMKQIPGVDYAPSDL
jgi:hypothetical protein